MSEFVFGFKSPTHEVHVQIPVCLLGKSESDIVSNLKNCIGQTEKEPVEGKKSNWIFDKKPTVKEEDVDEDVEKKKNGDGLTMATGILLLSSMILAAMKD